MRALKILAFVLAGGEGTRLHPLTSERSKPAVPFAGRYRIVDFVLSSLVNSGIHSIYILVQYKSQSLIEHVNQAWLFTPNIPDQFLTVVPPQMREGPDWFQGTADAVCQNLNLIERHAPDLVAVFGADHVYRMDVRQMIDFHLQHGADLTVSARPVPLAEASDFGVIGADRTGRVTSFDEKPDRPAPIPTDPERAYCSMGNYLFNPKWPISTKGYPGPSPKIVEGTIHNSILGSGTLVKGAKLTNSIIRREVVLERDVEIEDSIIMDYTKIRQGARLQRVIVDRYNTIEAGQRIGYDLDADRRQYHVTESGIVVVSKGRHRVDDTHYY